MSYCNIHTWRGHKYLDGTCQCGKSKINAKADNLIKQVLRDSNPSLTQSIIQWITDKPIGIIFGLFMLLFCTSILPPLFESIFSVAANTDNSSSNITVIESLPHFPLWLMIFIPGLLTIAIVTKIFRFNQY